MLKMYWEKNSFKQDKYIIYIYIHLIQKILLGLSTPKALRHQ